jgi:hypothetical protein
VLHGPEVAHDPGVHLGVLSARGAGEVFSRHVAVVGTDGEGGGDGEVGDREMLRDGSYQALTHSGVADLLPEKAVEDGAPVIEGLQGFLVLAS